jgi:hypothetical protein
LCWRQTQKSAQDTATSGTRTSSLGLSPSTGIQAAATWPCLIPPMLCKLSLPQLWLLWC